MNYKFSFIFLLLMLLFLGNIYVNAQPETKTIAFVSKASVVDENGIQADKPFIDDLLAEGYKIDTLYSAALETSDSLINVLNSADLVIIGRSGASGDFGGTHKAAWNTITSPVLLLHPWAARNNRLNWLPTGTTTSFDTGGDTISAKIEVPDDTVFADSTIASDSTMDWVITPYDYMATTSGGNGTVLAREAVSSSVLFVRWDPWVEFYNDAGDGAAGYRTLIGNGNDHANATNGAPFNYYNFTAAAKQVYLNEVARMVNLPEPPPKPVGFGKKIAFVSLPGKIDPATNENADKPFIDDLKAQGYAVNSVYTASLETASQGLVDTLNNADLVIIGRSGSSGDFGGTHKTAWNNITSPLMALHLYIARNNRLNWLPTATTTANDNAGDTIKAKIVAPNDTVFTGVTIAADSTMGWVTTPYDYMETTSGGNGTVLARVASSSNVLFVRWVPWVEFYNSAGDYPAGYRTLIGNGNDHAGPFNYYNFTADAKMVYLNEVERMVNLPAPPPKPAGLGKTIAFISLASTTDPNTGKDADQPFIDDLLAEEYKVNTHYSSSLETDSALVDTLNSADLVIIGRTGASGDFGGTHKTAWNNITSPVLLLHLWAARNNRLNWLPTGTTSQFDTGGDTISAKIEVPDDSVFIGVTIAADSTMKWVTTPYDYMATTDGGNGTVMAREAISSNVLFERWDPWVEFYSGAVDMPAGFRTLIGNGNDHAYASGGDAKLFNYYNFTDAAKQVYMNEVARMAKLGKVQEPVSVAEGDNIIPTVYALEQNYPNPFNPTTTIKFALPKNSNVKINIYDILGRVVTRLVDGNFAAGYHKVQFNASNLASGVYFYRIEAGNFVNVKKLMLLK
jgi:Secretion system C-terminal sorting domain